MSSIDTAPQATAGFHTAGLNADKASKSQERYEEIEEVGRGSFGVVVRSFDSQLEREVAVKKLNTDICQDDDILQRFLNESLITGQLEHPGIVPVYERSVCAKAGHPFYAMKILKGPTFAEEIREYHDMLPGAARREAFHSLLHRFVDVCEAIGFAHSQDVIHRDLKPSNVVVGEFGETIVVDWGLAKRIHETQEAVAEPIEKETMVAGKPSLDEAHESCASTATQMGTIAGTPEYMSPEQAAGQIDKIDARSDVFALAAILYEILVGRTPFQSSDSKSTIASVLQGEYPTPREAGVRVPRPLESICRVGLSPSRDDRYENAILMASDVKRFLAGERVTVHNESFIDRAHRFTRRKALTVIGASAVVFVAAILSIIAGVVVKSAHNQEVEAHAETRLAHQNEALARQAEEQAKLQVLQRLEKTRQAGDGWLFGLSHSLKQVAGFDAIRRDLLSRAIGHYQEIYDSLRSEPTEAVEAGICLVRIGNLHLLLRELPRARTAFQQASDLLKPYTTGGSALSHGIARCERSNASVGLALIDIMSGQPSETGLDELRGAVNTLASLESKGQVDVENAHSLSRGRLVLAIKLALAAHPSEAIKVLRSAIESVERLPSFQQNAQQIELLGSLRMNLASILVASGGAADGRLILRDHIRQTTLRLQETLRPDWLASRGVAQMRLGDTHQIDGDWQDARKSYTRAIDDLGKSSQMLLGDQGRNEQLALANAKLGTVCYWMQEYAESAKHLGNAVAQLQVLNDREPSSFVDPSVAWPFANLDVSGVEQNVATGAFELAKPMAVASILTSTRLLLGQVLIKSDPQEARQHFTASINVLDDLSEKVGLRDFQRLELAVAHMYLATSKATTGGRETELEIAEAIGRLESLYGTKVDFTARRACAEAKFQLAECLLKDGLQETGNAMHAEAVDLLKALAKHETPEQAMHPNSATTRLRAATE